MKKMPFKVDSLNYLFVTCLPIKIAVQPIVSCSFKIFLFHFIEEKTFQDLQPTLVYNLFTFILNKS